MPRRREHDGAGRRPATLRRRALHGQHSRPRADHLWVVVNDGLRAKVRFGGAWVVESLAGMVETYGNDLHGKYLDVCKFLLKEKASQAGYSLTRFGGYYCGHKKIMTHYLALLTLQMPGDPS